MLKSEPYNQKSMAGSPSSTHDSRPEGATDIVAVNAGELPGHTLSPPLQTITRKRIDDVYTKENHTEKSIPALEVVVVLSTRYGGRRQFLDSDEKLVAFRWISSLEKAPTSFGGRP
jgi:hypothetical protein